MIVHQKCVVVSGHFLDVLFTVGDVPFEAITQHTSRNQCSWQIWGHKKDKIWPVMPKYVTESKKTIGPPILWLAQLISGFHRTVLPLCAPDMTVYELVKCTYIYIHLMIFM